MNFLADITEQTVSSTRGGAAISKLNSVSGSGSAISVGFYEGAEPVKLPSTYSLWFGFVTSDDTVIALTEEWTYNAAANRYEGTFSTNTDEVVTALGASDSITVYAQLIWKRVDADVPTKSQVIEVTLRKSVLGFDATTPLALDTPAVWLAEQLAEATDKVTPVDGDSVPLSDSAADGALKKLTFANLWTWIQGKAETLYVRTTEQTLEAPEQLQARTNIGLGAVNNTTDADKPVSAAQQEALDGKVPLAIHQAEAPSTSISEITVSGLTGDVAALGNGTIIPAGAATSPDTDGREGFTDNAMLDGAVFVRGAYYASAFGEWRYRVTVSSVNYTWRAIGVTDETIDDIASWTWTPASGSETFGTPVFVISGTALDPEDWKYGQMVTSDAEPNLASFLDAEGNIRKLPTLPFFQASENSFRLVLNDEGGYDLALWNSTQEVFQKITLSGNAGLETLSFES